MAITDLYLSGWHGIAPEHTESMMDGAELAVAPSVLRRLTAGQTTQIWTRPDSYFGQSNENMESKFHGQI